MRRTLLALVGSCVATGVVLFATYQAFSALLPIVPQGFLLGFAVFGLGVLCIVGCALIGCVAHRSLDVSPAEHYVHGKR